MAVFIATILAVVSEVVVVTLLVTDCLEARFNNKVLTGTVLEFAEE